MTEERKDMMPDEIYCHKSSSGIVHTWLVPESAYLRGGCNYIRADADGIVAWADGVLSAMGTEYASRVTDAELTLAGIIRNADLRPDAMEIFRQETGPEDDLK